MTVHTHHAAGTPAWTDLMTPKPEALREFYRAMFGWTYQTESSENGDYTVILAGQNPIAAMVPPMDGQSLWFLYFATDDVYAGADRIRQLGGQVVMDPGPVGDSGHLLIARDPTGAPFGLWQAGQHHGMTLTEVPGTFTWAELHTPDAARAREFYTALLGNISQAIPDMDYHVLYHGEQQNVGVEQMADWWPAGMSPQWLIYFEVENTDRALRTTESQGGRVLSAPQDTPYGRLAVMQDPAGAIFAVVQRPMD